MPSAPGTPSPCFSDISLPSEDGPYTPLDVPGPLPSITVTSSPDASAAHFHIHSVLGYRPGSTLPILYDVVHPPTSMGFNMTYTPDQASRVLAEPATNPPAASMTLASDLLPYVIHVQPGAAAAAGAPVPSPLPSPGTSPSRAHFIVPGTYVSVQDVLATVYAFLRTPLTQAEFAKLPPAQQATVAAAFNARCANAPDTSSREQERHKGVKRIDMLIAAGRTRFAGLGATRQPGKAVWILNLA
jgi:hypothetical protein